MAKGTPFLSFVLRVVDRVFLFVLVGATKILRALPSRWVLRAADVGGSVLQLLDARGRRVGRQNLQAVFGASLSKAEKRAILASSFRHSVRSLFLLLHVSPMTRERYEKWVDVPADAMERLRAAERVGRGGALVSGHVGNWELLLGLASAFDRPPPWMFLAEAMSRPALNRFLESLRGTGGGASVISQGGARAAARHVRGGGGAALLVDRNTRRNQGGIWAPFLGLPARTTPLPAWLARRHGAALLVILCLPREDGRYRIWVGPELNQGVHTDDEDADILELTRRVNATLEEVVRARPDLWNWTLKRFKSRPTQELGAYPPYSLWDPD